MKTALLRRLRRCARLGPVRIMEKVPIKELDRVWVREPHAPQIVNRVIHVGTVVFVYGEGEAYEVEFHYKGSWATVTIPAEAVVRVSQKGDPVRLMVREGGGEALERVHIVPAADPGEQGDPGE